MKTCKTCGETKSRADFYRASRASDGLSSECKTCSRQRARRWRYNNYDRAKATWQQSWSKADPSKRAAHGALAREHKARHPERIKARAALNRAIKAGTIVRQPCSECGAPEANGHHHDYSKPLEVEWLCSACHGAEHRTSEEGIAHSSTSA